MTPQCRLITLQWRLFQLKKKTHRAKPARVYLEYDSAFELYIPNYNFSCNAVSNFFNFNIIINQFLYLNVTVNLKYFNRFLQVSFSVISRSDYKHSRVSFHVCPLLSIINYYNFRFQDLSHILYLFGLSR